MANRPKCRENIDKMTEKTSSSLFTDNKSITSSKLEEPFLPEFADIPPPEDLPSVENDFLRAKSYLLKQCSETGDNLYDHLSEVLNKILSERPRGIGDVFEEYSRQVRHDRFRQKTDHMKDVIVPPEYFEVSQKLMSLLTPPAAAEPEEVAGEDDDEFLDRKPNLMELLYFFEQAGVGLPRSEMFCIAVAMKKLSKMETVHRARFWGKILGTKKNYIVVETDLTSEEYTRRNEEREEKESLEKEERDQENKEKEEHDKEEREMYLELAKQREIDFAKERTEALAKAMLEKAEEEGIEEVEIPEPKPFKPWPSIPLVPVPPPIEKVILPREQGGTGINRKVFYVINEPGDEWYQLPDVTPQEIVAARLVKRSFTGDLDSPVITYPKFPGTEKNYLRAQIARISAATQISPLGYYTFNEDEEMEEMEEETLQEGKIDYTENPAFEPLALRDLIDTSMAFWVHHTQHILKQGRTVWWNPSPKPEVEGEEEEEGGEGEEESNEPEKETGPALLTPLSEDVPFEGLTPWTTRSTSALLPEFSIAIVRSNIWPGAFAFATDKKFDNVYIGSGHKTTAYNHSPLPSGPIEEEYPIGPEILEILDPTPEEEEAWRKAHEKKPPPPMMPEGEAEEEESEDED